jgi:starch synthase
MSAGLNPDVIHCNDWQTALIPLYRGTLYNNEFFSKTITVLTIHNLGYQGLFDASDLPFTGLNSEWFTPEGIEFYGKVNFLKGGLIAADILTTVSDTYAHEILTPEYGYGLDGVLRKRSSDLYGVLNGIDTEEWDPRKDTHIPAHYGLSDITGKEVCKRKLLQECSLDPSVGNAPLVAVVGRLSQQKGLDILIESVDDIISMGVGLVIFGKGDATLHAQVLGIAERHQGAAFVKIGYDESLAHRIYAGSDIFLMPSQYEPCGLGQLIAMKYGTIPVARKTGGLADTITDYDPVTDFGTGFLFEEYGAAYLKECMKRALCVFTEKKRWKQMIVRAMGMDFSWETSATKYVELFGRAVKAKRATG